MRSQCRDTSREEAEAATKALLPVEQLIWDVIYYLVNLLAYSTPVAFLIPPRVRVDTIVITFEYGTNIGSAFELRDFFDRLQVRFSINSFVGKNVVTSQSLSLRTFIFS